MTNAFHRVGGLRVWPFVVCLFVCGFCCCLFSCCGGGGGRLLFVVCVVVCCCFCSVLRSCIGSHTPFLEDLYIKFRRMDAVMQGAYHS